ncbi:MAG: hypothetical protein ABJG47_14210 [Ekhidna sp.]
MNKKNMRSIYYSLLTMLLITSCMDKEIRSLSLSDKETLSEFKELPMENICVIAGADEPGQPLLLCLTLFNKETLKPLSGQRISFYHTSTEGTYDPVVSDDESTARLNGSGVTDSLGRIFVRTILPGDYGSSNDNRHIHTSVFDAHPSAYDIHFKQYSGIMGRRFIDGSKQHFLADLVSDNNQNLVTFLDMYIEF